MRSPAPWLCWLFVLGPGALRGSPAVQDPLLERLAEEAEVFRQVLDKVVGEELLEQRALKPRGPRLRVGGAVTRPHPVEYQTRTLRSEFGYAVLGEGAGNYHEARQVIEVDGRLVTTREKARRRLVMGLRSGEEEVRKRLLEDLVTYGLEGAATDFSLCLLLFRGRLLEDYEWWRSGEERLGADRAMVFAFQQRRGDQSLTVFQGKKLVRQALTGNVWIRADDGLPLKIRLVSSLEDPPGGSVLDIGEVEYARGASLAVLPVVAVHRRFRGPLLLSEETFRYSGFKRFSADSEIRFTPIEELSAPDARREAAPSATEQHRAGKPPATRKLPAEPATVTPPAVPVAGEADRNSEARIVPGIPYHPGAPVGPGAARIGASCLPPEPGHARRPATRPERQEP